MVNNPRISACLFVAIVSSYNLLYTQPVPSSKTRGIMVLVNNYFMERWPDPGNMILNGEIKPGNSWNRSVYFEGLMALYKINPDQKYLNYALSWGDFHKWDLPGGVKTRDPMNQCCAQTYIDIYLLNRYKEERINEIRACIDTMMAGDKKDDWTTTDALQMAMPVLARLGMVYDNESYFERLNEMYLFTKLKCGTGGLYSNKEHLWWRDSEFAEPYKEPNGENCFWSRGNGWVTAALVRTLEFLPEHSKYRKEYEKTLVEMFKALVPLQRNDGFWNVSLRDSSHFGGKELTGTALFTYSLAWCINKGLISSKEYMPVVLKAWNAIIKESVHNDGFLGYVQGTGKEPKDSQPVGYDVAPDFQDFGIGCFLLAGSEVYKMSKALEPKVKAPKVSKKKKEEAKSEMEESKETDKK